MDKFECFGRHNVFTNRGRVFLDNQCVSMTWDEAVLAAQACDEADQEMGGDGFASQLVLGIVVLLMAAGCVVAAVLAMRGMA